MTLDFAIALMRLIRDNRDGASEMLLTELWELYSHKVSRLSSGKFIDAVVEAINLNYLEPAFSVAAGQASGLRIDAARIGLPGTRVWTGLRTEDAENQLRALNAEKVLDKTAPAVAIPPRSRPAASEETTINIILSDTFIRSQVYALLHADYLKRQFLDEMTALMKLTIEKSANADLAFSSGSATRATMRAVDKIVAIVEQRMGEITDELKAAITDYARQHRVTAYELIKALSPVELEIEKPSAADVRDRVKAPMEGRTIDEWVAGLLAGLVGGVRKALFSAANSGVNPSRLLQRVFNISMSNLDGVTRTAIVHINTQVLADVLSTDPLAFKERYTAILDGRTTARCRALDGKLYTIGEGPHPPLHFRCRSMRIPIFSDRELPVRPMTSITTKQMLREFTEAEGIPAVTRRADLPHGYKKAFDTYAARRLREMIGPAPADLDYEAFLRRQTVSFQDAVLGKTKARLFRTGKLSLAKFVSRDGSEMTLAELAAAHADVFQLAGLEPSEWLMK